MAQGQTGRIAHFSHGGSAATLAAAAGKMDNFGEPVRMFESRVDSVVYQTDSTATIYSHQRARYNAADKNWHPVAAYDFYYKYPNLSWAEVVAKLQSEYPQAKFVGFDKKKPVLKPKLPHKKGHTKTAALPPPRSFWQGLAAVAGCVLVGWLLGGAAPHRGRATAA